MASAPVTDAPGPGDEFVRALELHRAGELPQAAELYRKLCLEAGPRAADARTNLGAILAQWGRHREAIEEYREALALKGEDPLALNNLGNSLVKLGEFACAGDAFRRAVAQAPDCLPARLALGSALQKSGELPAAIACFREILQDDPACAEAHFNLSLALLMSGEFREGWLEYQWRWRKGSFTSPRRAFRQPLWDGSPLAGRRILVHAEQGLGDTIQFMRYLPLLGAAGGTVLAECQSPPLIPLFRRVPGVSAAYLMGEELPPFDLQVPLLSLPYLLGTTLDSVPARVPYLEADPARLASWRERLAGSAGLRVGVVWAGKPVPDPFRSCPLEALAPLGGIPGVNLYSLQLGVDGARAIEEVPELELIDLTAEIHDFADTAALISLLDLVISIDTSVAHLAGALGKPVWLLLPEAGDWRWLSGRDDSPWYPTMRIFRQRRQGEWGEPVERVSAELKVAAWDLLRNASATDPFNGWLLQLCGSFLASQGRHREAVVRFSKAATLLRGEWEPHYGLGTSLQLLGRPAEARESLENAVALNGELPLLHEALGIARQLLGDLEGAIRCYRQALSLDPGAVKSRFNLATACRDRGEIREALAQYREVTRLAPGHADAHWNLAAMLLLTGELAEGWRGFHWRFRKSSGAPLAKWQDRPRWDGSPPAGRTVLLWAEQGLGDTLQFVRYAPLVADRGGRVLVELQSRALASLVSRLPGVAGVLVSGEDTPPFDLQASLLELPQIFATDLDSIPAAVPYLQTDSALVAQARARVPQDGSLRVGVVWSGNPGHSNDASRSLRLERLAPLAAVPGVSCYSLQLGGAAEAAEASFTVTDLAGAIADFSDTAALAAALDLVITVDTSVAHLCGALGLPVWVLIPFLPDWRWLLEREASPWYPTMRLFRQQAPGDWEPVIARVRESLAQVVAVRGAGEACQRHRALGLALSEQGRNLEAAAEFEQALALHADDVELINNLGCALDRSGDSGRAEAAYRRGISLNPRFMALHYNLGNTLKRMGRAPEAVDCYRCALSLEPTLAQGWHNLALSLQETGRLDEAKEALERAIELRPDYREARHNLGELHHARGELAAAADRFREVLAQEPGYVPSWNALGNALLVEERLEEAVECYRHALSLKPDYLHALNNLGAASRALGSHRQAVECYRRVIALDPDYADARWNLSLVQLQLGQYEEGWQGYEWRFRKLDPIPRRSYPQPLWNGSPLAGRVILLHAEQGFGDSIQFVRYVPVLAGQGAQVLVECQSRAIAPLLRTVPGVAGVLVRGEELPPFDVHAPFMSLPLLCGTSLSSIPAQIPYLAADPRLVEKWRPRLSGEGMRVGVVWAGRKSYKDDHKRSLSLALFAPLAGIDGVRLYSLQVGEGAEQLDSPPAGLEIGDLSAGIESFADTAAIVSQLDLVISADTAVAHLAGALGKPVWVLLPLACDWRWLLRREDSPWYPSARLFRQRARGEWPQVLSRVAAELARMAEAAKVPPSIIPPPLAGGGEGEGEASAARQAGGSSAVVPSPAGPYRPGSDGRDAAGQKKTELAEALQAGRLERAGELCRELLVGSPADVELLTVAGTLAHRKGTLDEALSFFSRAAAVAPELAELRNNLGVVLEELGRHREAAQRYREALALKPGYCEASCHLGNVLKTLGEVEEAIRCYRAALAFNPLYAEAYYNLGNALRGEGRWDEAVESYRGLLALKPDHLSGWINLGGALLAMNLREQAVEAERKAIELAPENADAHWNLALALLAGGELGEGWREYEWRLKNSAAGFSPGCAGRPLWDGAPLAGRTLLLRSEQGLGDALQFFRYARLLARQGERVVLECRPELLPLFACQDAGVRCFAAGQEPPPFDTFAYLMSLPHLLGATLAGLPSEVPYLQADQALSAGWEKRMPGDGVKVGVVWAGSAGYRNDRDRSLSLHELAPLAALPGIELYSLQMGEAAAQLRGVPWGGALRDLSGELRDFADTAAVIERLDLMLTVDTAVAHLAGALGKPVFLLLPFSCDWRWLYRRSDSPWYPSMRLYRQERRGDWAPVIAAVLRDLAPDTAELNRRFREANALRAAGRLDESVAAYRMLLAVKPRSAEIHNNLGLALQDQGRLAEAAHSYRRALALAPRLADAHNNLGTLLVSQGEREAALPCFRQALAVRADFLPACINLGSCLQQLERPEEALPLYRRALELRPDSLEARVNLGTAYQELKEPERAIEVYRDGLRLAPRHPELHWNLALSLLSIGDFARGWCEYDWRLQLSPPPEECRPLWEGEPLAGRSILLRCEQGLGDTLQFVRYAPLVASRGGRVLLNCQYPSLKPLLARLPGVAGVFARGEELPPYHCQAPLLSLPRIFGTTLDRVPSAPYLSAGPASTALWRGRMPAGPLRVGLTWKGGALPKNRACPYAEFAALDGLPGIAFYSMQLGEGPLPQFLEAHDLAPQIGDFGDSAAILANLDLLISIDTAAAHLAGGMGVPVWLLLPYACDWRWLMSGDGCAWYPSMRIFRQKSPADWRGVLARVREALAELTGKGNG